MFECHVTLNLSDKEIGEQLGTEFHWSTSEIERDPVLGKASYFYLTTHDTDLQRMYRRMDTIVAAAKARGIFVVREKIEVIIHDTKKKVPPAVARDSSPTEWKF